MKVKIIVSKRIEETFNLHFKNWLIQNKILHKEIQDLPHYLNDIDLEGADFFIAINIHSLKDYPKQFCVHPAGNWGELWPHSQFKNLGGKANTLSKSSSLLLKETYHSLLKNNNLSDYIVNIECTHHGPSVSKPLVFLEIGCSLKEWEDTKALEVIKKTILDLQKIKNKRISTSIVLGGDHYMINAAKILRTRNTSISHMCPSSQIHNISIESLREVLRKSHEPIDQFILDLAGIGQHKDRIINILEELNEQYVFMHNL